ncbi:MAG: hypothetical protein LBV41_03975 [Cytophagaceae bacterium]|jgi:hypothetical protein|nr:hypothetical protein [Cytophagaceae bacterium]
MRKVIFLFDAARVFAMAVCVCLVAFLASCDKPDDPEPDPKPSSSLESISITAPTVKDANRTITDKAGEFSYADKADATVKMTFKNAEPAAKDSAIVIDLVSKVTWLTTVTKVALAGDLVLTPTLTGTDKISVKYGTLEVKDLFTVSNTSFKVTRSGKSADMPFFGFNKVEAIGEATNEVTYVTESGKDYTVNTLTQTFKLSHSDGTTKEVEVKVLEAKMDITGVTPVLVGYEELKDKFSQTVEIVDPATPMERKVAVYSYTVRRNYSVGAPSDTTFTYVFEPQINIPFASYIFSQLDSWPNNLVFEAEEIIEENVALLSSTNVTSNLKVDLYKGEYGIKYKYLILEDFSKLVAFSFVFPKELKYSEKDMEAITLSAPEPEAKVEGTTYDPGSYSDQTLFKPEISVSYGDVKFTARAPLSAILW